MRLAAFSALQQTEFADHLPGLRWCSLTNTSGSQPDVSTTTSWCFACSHFYLNPNLIVYCAERGGGKPFCINRGVNGVTASRSGALWEVFLLGRSLIFGARAEFMERKRVSDSTSTNFLKRVPGLNIPDPAGFHCWGQPGIVQLLAIDSSVQFSSHSSFINWD